MDTEQVIRELAKKSKYQNLFVAVKDLNGFVLFNNKNDLTRIQEIFLSYLYFYYEIYQDIATKKIDKMILKNETYEDAYMYWKREKGIEKKDNKKKNANKTKNDLMLVFDNNVKVKEKNNGR
jgi:hypothetical protein